jgi:hypothetical protein
MQGAHRSARGGVRDNTSGTVSKCDEAERPYRETQRGW